MKSPTSPDQGWWGEQKTTSCQLTADPTGASVNAASSRLNWGPVRTHVALLRGRDRPDAPVLLTLFPPQATPGEKRGWSEYYLTTAGKLLDADPPLVKSVAAALSRLGVR